MSTRKRASLDTVQLAANARKGKTAASASTGKVKATAISLPQPHWDLLRGVALKRAASPENRFSVSRVIADLIEENWDKLKQQS